MVERFMTPDGQVYHLARVTHEPGDGLQDWWGSYRGIDLAEADAIRLEIRKRAYEFVIGQYETSPEYRSIPKSFWKKYRKLIFNVPSKTDTLVLMRGPELEVIGVHEMAFSSQRESRLPVEISTGRNYQRRVLRYGPWEKSPFSTGADGKKGPGYSNEFFGAEAELGKVVVLPGQSESIFSFLMYVSAHRANAMASRKLYSEFGYDRAELPPGIMFDPHGQAPDVRVDRILLRCLKPKLKFWTDLGFIVIDIVEPDHPDEPREYILEIDRSKYLRIVDQKLVDSNGFKFYMEHSDFQQQFDQERPLADLQELKRALLGHKRLNPKKRNGQKASPSASPAGSRAKRRKQ
jgi:hypothetical protein